MAATHTCILLHVHQLKQKLLTCDWLSTSVLMKPPAPARGIELRPCQLTMRQGDAGSIQDGLSQLMVVSFRSIGGSLEGIPDLLSALKGRCCVPELISFAPQLPISHGIVTLPLEPLLLQGLIATWVRQMQRLGISEAT